MLFPKIAFGHLKPSCRLTFRRPSRIAGLVFGALLWAQSAKAGGSTKCVELFSPNDLKPAAKFLIQRSSQLHLSKPIERAVSKARRSGQTVSQGSIDRVSTWLGHLEEVYTNRKSNPSAVEHYKTFLESKYVIKRSEIPESYYAGQVRLERERGQGAITLSAAEKTAHADIVIADQKASIDRWIDYFFSNDSDVYPAWSKVWALQSIAKLSKYDPETSSFRSRTKGNVAPFPELNPEAFAIVIDAVLKKIGRGSLDEIKDPNLVSLLADAQFAKLYSYAFGRFHSTHDPYSATEGHWIRYPQGSDARSLVASLEGRNTGWCTAGHSTAQSQLETGDFYIYYSRDKQGQYAQPRIAIRMNGPNIAEIRGVSKDQNLDAVIAKTDILDTKLQEFGNRGYAYQLKTEDMRRVTEMEKRGVDSLSASDLRFLYEVDRRIEGFGQNRDPRIDDLRKARKNPVADVNSIFDGIEEHTGSLRFNFLENADGLKLPRIVHGTIQLSAARSAVGARLPEIVDGNLNLDHLTNGTHVAFPKYVSGALTVGLESARNVQLPLDVDSLILSRLQTADGLVLPSKIDSLVLDSLTSARGLKLPSGIKNLWMTELESAEDLKLPVGLTGELRLNKLREANNLVLPPSLTLLNLESLVFATGVQWPSRVDRLILSRLNSPATFPEYFHGNLELQSVNTVAGLTLPKKLYGTLSLPSLIDGTGLRLPSFVEGDLNLKTLKLATDIVWPQKVSGKVNLWNPSMYSQD